MTAMTALVAALGGCGGQPERLCDRLFLSWAFPAHELTPADDVSDAPGLQIEVVINSELPPGRLARLFITGPDEIEVQHPEIAVVDFDGQIRFPAVDVPLGSVLFRLETDDGCRLVQTSQRRFVRDGLGDPACEISFSPEPETPTLLAPALVYNRLSDPDTATIEIDVDVEVFAGRPGSEVTLLFTDVDASSTSTEVAEVDAGGLASFSLALAEGNHAIRAICRDDFGGVPLSTATFPFVIDITSPDCALLSPSAAVSAGDDIDPDTDGVQILLVGQTSAVDAVGANAAFFTQATGIIDGETINAAGQSTAVATVSTDPAEQRYSFSAFDIAGNLCTDQSTF